MNPPEVKRAGPLREGVEHAEQARRDGASVKEHSVLQDEAGVEHHPVEGEPLCVLGVGLLSPGHHTAELSKYCQRAPI